MKKHLLLLTLLFCSLGAKAQIVSKLTGINLEIMAGVNANYASDPLGEKRIGYNAGLMLSKDLTSFVGIANIYGLVGAEVTRRGGKLDDDISTIINSDKKWGVTALAVPIHFGGELDLKVVSIFADLGPNLLFKLKSSDIENLETEKFAFGGGVNVGVRFMGKFAISAGYDLDFTKFGTFRPNADQINDYSLEKDKYNLKTSEFHLDLRWNI